MNCCDWLTIVSARSLNAATTKAQNISQRANTISEDPQPGSVYTCRAATQAARLLHFCAPASLEYSSARRTDPLTADRAVARVPRPNPNTVSALPIRRL